jgi:hypothetical protein
MTGRLILLGSQLDWFYPDGRAADPPQKLQCDNLSCRIQTPYITRIAGSYKVPPLPGDYHDRRVDNIRSPRGAAEFSAGTGKLVASGR